MENKKIQIIGKKTEGRCFYCNKSNPEHIDHFVSKAKWKEWGLTEVLGDVNELENLFLACKKCNLRKSDKYPEEFIGNSYKAWDRYRKANLRIGIDVGGNGFDGDYWTPIKLEKFLETDEGKDFLNQI